MHGLDEYDSDARWYYPAIMRTTTIDPLADKYYSISPYAWCLGNPINRIDPDGRVAPLIIMLGKGAIGALIDASSQVLVSMANGKTFNESMSNIDYTSVGASFVTSALTMPGMSTTVKVATTAEVVTTDALVDINNQGVVTSEIIGGEKSTTSTVVDVVGSITPSMGVDNLTKNFNKAVSSDLSSTTASILTTGTKSSLKQAQSTVNSSIFQTTANSVADFTIGIVSGQVNESVNSNNSSSIKNSNPASTTTNTTSSSKPSPLKLEEKKNNFLLY